MPDGTPRFRRSDGISVRTCDERTRIALDLPPGVYVEVGMRGTSAVAVVAADAPRAATVAAMRELRTHAAMSRAAEEFWNRWGAPSEGRVTPVAERLTG